MSDIQEKNASHANSEDQSRNQSDAPLGEVFAKARLAKKYTQADASNYLKYSVAQVNALENDDFASLPQPMVMRGFIRNYARYLDLDPAPLLEIYKSRVPDLAPIAVEVKTAGNIVMVDKRDLPWLKIILVSGLILIPLVAWLLVVEYAPKHSKIQALTSTPVALIDRSELVLNSNLPTEVLTESLPLPESNLQDEVKQNPEVNLIPNDLTAATPSKNSISKPDAQKNANDSSLPSSSLGLNDAARLALSPKLADLSLKSVTNTNSSNLSTNTNNTSLQANIAVQRDVWVQALDANGRILLEKVLLAGANEAITGLKPFNITIGNASSAILTVAGKKIDLSPYVTENNVARIKLE